MDFNVRSQAATERTLRIEIPSQRVNSQEPAHPAKCQARFRWAGFAFAAAALAISLVAISRRSFWLDEAATVVHAIQPTLAAWWQQLVQEKAANLQTPLYMLYIWGCGKLCGSGEWTLRLANLPWFVAGAVAFIMAFPPRDRRRPIAACVTLLCPFAWYYLDEVRPYAMQLGAALFIFASLLQIRCAPEGSSQERRWVVAFCFGSLVLAASGMLAMLWLVAAILEPYLIEAAMSQTNPGAIREARRSATGWANSSIWLAAGGCPEFCVNGG